MPGSISSTSSSDSVYTRLSPTSAQSADYDDTFATHWAAINTLRRAVTSAEEALFQNLHIFSRPSASLAICQAIYPAGSDEHHRHIARLQAQVGNYNLLPVASQSFRRAPLMVAQQQASELVAQSVLDQAHGAVEVAAKDRKEDMIEALYQVGGLEEVQFRPRKLMDALDSRHVEREAVLHVLEAMWKIVKAQKELKQLVQRENEQINHHESEQRAFHDQMNRLAGVTASWSIEGRQRFDSFSSSDDEDDEYELSRRNRLQPFRRHDSFSSSEDDHEHRHSRRNHLSLIRRQNTSSSSGNEDHDHAYSRRSRLQHARHQDSSFSLGDEDCEPELDHRDHLQLVRRQNSLSPSTDRTEHRHSDRDRMQLIHRNSLSSSSSSDDGGEVSTVVGGHARSVYSSYPVIGGGARGARGRQEDARSVESAEDWEVNTVASSRNH